MNKMTGIQRSDRSDRSDRGPLKNIILDLDSTVISSLRPWVKQPKGLIGHDMAGDDDEQIEYIVYERPHLQTFLDYIFANFTVAVWTAASKDYAVFIADKILTKNKPERALEFLLFNYHGDLSEVYSECPKDLSMVYNTFPKFNKDNTIIIDDYEAVYIPQMSNSYPIPPFEADSPDSTKDTQLLRLQIKLQQPNLGTSPNDNLMTKTTIGKAIAKAERAMENE
jgi:TFIIF-interacting CTD phosphatase-like protein